MMWVVRAQECHPESDHMLWHCLRAPLTSAQLDEVAWSLELID
jgi:hypothetical protein